MNGYYPAVLQLRGRRCVVIGGGAVAQRKIRGLLEAGADDVVVVSPQVTPAIARLADEGAISLRLRGFEQTDIAGARLVFAATDDGGLNESIATSCEKLGILVNAADESGRSSFISPSVVRRGDLLLAVTASGASPALSRQIKAELESRYGPNYEALTARLRRLRERVLSTVLDEDDRKLVLELAAEEAVQQDRIHFDIDEWLQSLLHRIDRRQI